MRFNMDDELQHFMTLWTGRKSSGMDHGSAEWDKRSQGWVQELNENPVRAERSRRRVAETAAYLRRNGLLSENDSAIDIGCGPGRFVCEFAATAGHVTGTDISPEMCGAGKKHALSLGLKNTDFIPCDFKTADIDELGWRGAFDLVFSSITPAMNSYESLKKSEAMSRGWCFQSNFIKVTDSLADIVLPEILQEDLLPMERDISSFYVLLNVLLLEGRRPLTMYYTEEENVRAKADEAFVEEALKRAPKAARTPENIELIREGFLRYADADGYVSTHREWHYGWILWHI